MKDSAVKSISTSHRRCTDDEMAPYDSDGVRAVKRDLEKLLRRVQSPTIAASFSTVFQLRAVPSGDFLVFFQSRSSIECPTSSG